MQCALAHKKVTLQTSAEGIEAFFMETAAIVVLLGLKKKIDNR